MTRKSAQVSTKDAAEIARVLDNYRNETFACEATPRKAIGMVPAWYVTYAILGLYATNAVWLLYLGKPWGMAYWICAAGITICAMKGIAG